MCRGGLTRWVLILLLVQYNLELHSEQEKPSKERKYLNLLKKPKLEKLLLKKVITFI